MSASLIEDRVLKLYRSYKAFRKGNVRGAAKELGIRFSDKGKSASNNWLELQYGWLPLLQDIHGAYEELARPHRFGGMPIGVKARVARVERENRTKPLNPGSIDSTLVYEYRTQVCLWYRVDNEWLATASAVGMINPAELIWEAIPWSFVLDWIVPVGDVLGALTATVGTTFLAGTRTQTVKVSCTDVLNGGSFVSGAGSSYEYEATLSGNVTQSRRTFKMQRDVYRVSPVPTFYYKSPVSTGHALNALALFRGLFK